MAPVSVELENKLTQISGIATIIKWLAIVSVFISVLIPIVIISFLVYRVKFSNLKNVQYLSDIFNSLNGKTIKELKSIQKDSKLSEQYVAGLLIAHKSMTSVLIIVTSILAVCIVVIILSYRLGWH